MPTPFPGMDPYLEDPAYWRDFHARFINACSEVLNDRLPDGYEARIDEQLRLVEHDSIAGDRLPDVAVTHDPESPRNRHSHRNAVATLEPVTVPVRVEVEETRDAWIEIIHRPDRGIVTIIEVLSPTNKSGPGYFEYQKKRAGILRQNVNLFELDLLISGKRPVTGPALPEDDYYVLVTRCNRRESIDVFHWPLEAPLPSVPVPLRSGDSDVILDVAEVFRLAYQRGRYDRSLRYDRGPVAVLPANKLEWIRARATAI